MMKKEYDLSKLKSRKNPFAAKLKKQVTIRMGLDVVVLATAVLLAQATVSDVETK